MLTACFLLSWLKPPTDMILESLRNVMFVMLDCYHGKISQFFSEDSWNWDAHGQISVLFSENSKNKRFKWGCLPCWFSTFRPDLTSTYELLMNSSRPPPIPWRLKGSMPLLPRDTTSGTSGTTALASHVLWGLPKVQTTMLSWALRKWKVSTSRCPKRTYGSLRPCFCSIIFAGLTRTWIDLEALWLVDMLYANPCNVRGVDERCHRA